MQQQQHKQWQWAPISSIGVELGLVDHETAFVYATHIIPNVKTITLTLEKTDLTYASSSTAGVLKHQLGSSMATLEFTHLLDDFTNAYDVATDEMEGRIVFDAGVGDDFWGIKWLQFEDPSPMDVDIESESLIEVPATRLVCSRRHCDCSSYPRCDSRS